MYPYPAGQAWITSWGLVLLLAVAACWALARRNARRCDLDPSHVDLVIPVALVLGILASRAASALLPADRLLAGTEWVAASRVRLIPVALGGIAAVLLYARVTSQSGRRLLDVLALPALAGLGIQRVGCFLAGCCWGDVAVRSEQLDLLAGSGLGPQLQTFPWAVGGWGLAVAFPAGSFAWEQHRVAGLIPPEAAASLPVLPTQLYEAV
ncbi:MAG TPA: prolipoprotein diacylglyceryl transferase family protein, partial [Longimicrobiales bacterium]|nr:prolipoprotein diacylglyceryl transferase family protein [Longimicrobiales bacterium]